MNFTSWLGLLCRPKRQSEDFHMDRSIASYGRWFNRNGSTAASTEVALPVQGQDVDRLAVRRRDLAAEEQEVLAHEAQVLADPAL
jgi:hypothetical protein